MALRPPGLEDQAMSDPEFDDEEFDGYPEMANLADGWVEIVLNLPDRNSLGFYPFEEGSRLMDQIIDGLDRKMRAFLSSQKIQ